MNISIYELKIFFNFLLSVFLVLDSIFFSALNRANAQEMSQDIEINQINNVNDFSDVKPTDWAYLALQNLIQVYGYPQGYPDGTFRGNRVMSRYEFAAAFNRFLDLISDSGKLKISQNDLEIIRRLQIDFSLELEAVKSRIDELDKKIGVVEKNQFSTTTKLSGEVIFSTTAAFGNDKAIPAGTANSSSEEIEDNITSSGRVRLFLNTSFTGKDLLRVRLLAGNIQNLQSDRKSVV